MCPTGGGHKVLRKWADLWGISTDHFDRDAAGRDRARSRATPLEQVLVADSDYSRGALKKRLYREGLKERRCELCGQDEFWHGRRMSLILDHVNGDRRDHRLENLRIVCANCNATLDTHCGRSTRLARESRACLRCAKSFEPRYATQRYCSRDCGTRWARSGRPIPGKRRVERPPYEQLLAEIAATSFSAVGRSYGVSGNAIRKWVRSYERKLGDVEVIPQRGDDGVGGIALGDDRADAVDVLDHAGGLGGREGADDREEGRGAGVPDALDLGGVEGRQPEVEDDGVGLELGGHGDRLVPIRGGADDVEPGVGEDGAGQQAKARRVIADQDPGRRRHTRREHRRWRDGSA